MEIEVREVWAWNLKEEMEMIASIKDSFPFVAFDTEFPGFIASSSRGATPDELYGDVKLNVDSLKLIQVGLAFFDGFGMLPCSKPFCGVVWQFNLSDFDPSGDCHSPSAVEFLKENGIDFTASRRQGIASMRLCEEFWAAGLLGNPRLAWLCFHGTYDFAYMLKLIEGGEPLPSTRREFMEKVNRLFCNIYDLKYMAKFYDELRHGKLGLRRMAEILGVEEYLENSREEEEVKEGEGKHRYHQAGWDSLVTGMSFFQMDMIQEIQAMKQSSGDMPVVVDLSGLNAVLNGSNGVIFDMGTELIDAADAATDHLMAAYIWIDVKELCCCH
ncbi:probable CCR4-associated factor 1 homolog 9 [Nymphaea colorata]|nr:probable CCR4-associated factor 1 homolog 9 [Nymphaea colorata]